MSTFVILRVAIMQGIANSMQTDTVITHPDVVFYDFYEAYDDPNTTDVNLYLSKFYDWKKSILRRLS